MDFKLESQSKIEKMISDASFAYSQPWFYNNPYALRCELGIGVSDREYLKNAKRRAKEIFAILFSKSPDAVFFHGYEEIKTTEIAESKEYARCQRKYSRFLKSHTDHYECTLIDDIPMDDDEKESYTKKQRIIAYTDEKYPYKSRLSDNFSWESTTVHFVSFKNECILSVYDDRGCDIVFATPDKMRELYPLLKKYLLAYDIDKMNDRCRKDVKNDY